MNFPVHKIEKQAIEVSLWLDNIPLAIKSDLSILNLDPNKIGYGIFKSLIKQFNNCTTYEYRGESAYLIPPEQNGCIEQIMYQTDSEKLIPVNLADHYTASKRLIPLKHPLAVDVAQCNIVKETVFYAGIAQIAWGHNLLEFFTRLWPIVNYRKQNNIDPLTPIYLNHFSGLGANGLLKHLNSSHLRPYLDAFDMPQESFHFITKPTVFESVVVASPAVILSPSRVYCSDQSIVAWRYLNKKMTEGLPKSNYKRVYLSRRLLQKSFKNRNILNEIEVEAVFSSFGFDIVHPDTPDFTEKEKQLMLRDCECLAGAVGSGLLNTVFSSKPITVIGLSNRYVLKENPAALIQPALFSKICGHNFNFFYDNTSSSCDSNTWTVNTHLLRNHLQEQGL